MTINNQSLADLAAPLSGVDLTENSHLFDTTALAAVMTMAAELGLDSNQILATLTSIAGAYAMGIVEHDGVDPIGGLAVVSQVSNQAVEHAKNHPDFVRGGLKLFANAAALAGVKHSDDPSTTTTH